MKISNAFDSIAEGEYVIDYSWRDFVNSVTVLWGAGGISFVWWIVGVIKEML